MMWSAKAHEFSKRNIGQIVNETVRKAWQSYINECLLSAVPQPLCRNIRSRIASSINFLVKKLVRDEVALSRGCLGELLM